MEPLPIALLLLWLIVNLFFTISNFAVLFFAPSYLVFHYYYSDEGEDDDELLERLNNAADIKVEYGLL